MTHEDSEKIYPHYSDIGDFHAKFNLPSVTHDGVGPRKVPLGLFKFRKDFLQEELDELVEGYVEGDMVKVFDSLIDLVVVALGTAHLFGFPWQQGWDLVQQANMAKVRAQPDGSDSKRSSGYDIVKPPGWEPPDPKIAALLTNFGWDLSEKESE